MRRRWAGLGLVVLVCADAFPASVWAYAIRTHREIARQAVTVSSLDAVLKTDLGFPDGQGTMFSLSPGKSAKQADEWVRDGAQSEDEPDIRVLNHFHNPLRLWGEAGLRWPVLPDGQSSVLWQQNPAQSPGGRWSWQDARRRYLRALSASTKPERNQAFAELFRNLGQLTHLVQDATVPAHVRNDPHLTFVNPDGYEDWVERTRQSTPALFQSLISATLYVLPGESSRRPTTPGPRSRSPG